MSDFLTGPLGKTVYERTYSRVKEDGENEIWPETVQRVVDGNANYLPEELRPDEQELLEFRDLMLPHKITPAGRHLWTTGTDCKMGVMNCHVVGFSNDWSHFTDLFNLLMLGGGVGANYSLEFTSQLPEVKDFCYYGIKFRCDFNHPDIEDLKDFLGTDTKEDDKVFVVPDSREGWVEALQRVFEGETDVFDVSKVRPSGSPIKGFGGVASGPGPLVQMLYNVSQKLQLTWDRPSLKSLSPMDCLEIDHYIAEAVVAGNVRRSARMSCMHWADPYIEEFLEAKSEDGLHWSSNFSVEVDEEFFKALKHENSRALDVFEQVCEGMWLNGEPGFLNSSNTGGLRATNPCGEQWLEPGEACDLGHLNLALLDKEEVFHAARLMTRFLIRAHFADYVNEKQAEACTRNMRIGVGIYGVQEFVAKVYGLRWSEMMWSEEFAVFLQALYREIRLEADNYADSLGVNRPVTVTTIAPTGTVAKLSGHTEGIHPVFSKFFIRRVRFAQEDSALSQFADWQKEYDQNTLNTVVVSIPCRDAILDSVSEELVESVDEIHVNDLLGTQRFFQENYADNAISFTVNFDPRKVSVRTLSLILPRVLPHLKGTTMFPEVSRAQAPYERITREEYEAHVEDAEVSQGEDCETTGACPVR